MLDRSTVAAVAVVPGGPELALRWAGTAPAGSAYQVYVDGALVWSGPGTAATVRRPLGAGNHQILIGSVPAELGLVDNLAAPGSGSPLVPDRATLAWLGGSYLTPAIVGFRVYQGSDRSRPVGVVAAYPGGVVFDGYGRGVYGRGGYGHAAASYAWTSPVLAPGPWAYDVVPYDDAGAEGPARSYSGTLVGPPRAPTGVVATLAPTGRVALSWSPSPS